MASFFDDIRKSNIILAADLIKFIDMNIEHRELIEWEVDILNAKAIKQYEKLLTTRGFIWNKKENRTARRWIYRVTGKSKS
jgi:hypothetical protein